MVLVLTLFVLAVSAKEKQHLPLSAQVLSAKTVYIDNSARDHECVFALMSLFVNFPALLRETPS